jgi:hypothetical protein
LQLCCDGSGDDVGVECDSDIVTRINYPSRTTSTSTGTGTLLLGYISPSGVHRLPLVVRYCIAAVVIIRSAQTARGSSLGGRLLSAVRPRAVSAAVHERRIKSNALLVMTCSFAGIVNIPQLYAAPKCGNVRHCHAAIFQSRSFCFVIFIDDR